MRGCLLLFLCALPCIARTAEPPAFAGDYGHAATASADDVVWQVEEAGHCKNPGAYLQALQAYVLARGDDTAGSS